MRVVGEIPSPSYPSCKISIFSWNGKFLLKFELNGCEQIFKVAEIDIGSLENLKARVDDSFLSRVMARFEDMHGDRLALES